MLEATATAGSELFASISDETLREEVARFLNLLVEAADGAEAARLLDYRYYFDYDMLMEDVSLPPEERRWISVDRQSGKFSGGEIQSPYFIAILASYLRAYRRQDRHRNSSMLALVPIDEAFSKLSGERIADCIDALKQLDLQGVFSMSTGNIPGAFEKCEHLLVISKDERRVESRWQMSKGMIALPAIAQTDGAGTVKLNQRFLSAALRHSASPNLCSLSGPACPCQAPAALRRA